MTKKSTYPPLSSTIGKTAHLTFPEGNIMTWRVIDEIRIHENQEKILLLQRLQSIGDPRNQMFRFGYYIIGKKPKVKDRWVWGQFAPFISAKDFELIIGEARKKSWIK